MTEPTLAERLAADLDGTFEELVLAMQGPVYRFAYRWCGNAQDAEEIAQDAFVRAYRALQGYGPERIAALRLTPWLLTITINLLLFPLTLKQELMAEPELFRLDLPDLPPAERILWDVAYTTGTTTGRPLSTTFAVTPSPTPYREAALSVPI